MPPTLKGDGDDDGGGGGSGDDDDADALEPFLGLSWEPLGLCWGLDWGRGWSQGQGQGKSDSPFKLWRSVLARLLSPPQNVLRTFCGLNEMFLEQFWLRLSCCNTSDLCSKNIAFTN